MKRNILFAVIVAGSSIGSVVPSSTFTNPHQILTPPTQQQNLLQHPQQHIQLQPAQQVQMHNTLQQHPVQAQIQPTLYYVQPAQYNMQHSPQSQYHTQQPTPQTQYKTQQPQSHYQLQLQQPTGAYLPPYGYMQSGYILSPPGSPVSLAPPLLATNQSINTFNTPMIHPMVTNPPPPVITQSFDPKQLRLIQW